MKGTKKAVVSQYEVPLAEQVLDVYICPYRYIIWQVNNNRKEMSHQIFLFSFSLHYFPKMFIYKRCFALMC